MQIFGIKSLSGVAFENPSYLKEINTDVMQNVSIKKMFYEYE